MAIFCIAAPICKKNHQFFVKMKAKVKMAGYQYVTKNNFCSHFGMLHLCYKNGHFSCAGAMLLVCKSIALTLRKLCFYVPIAMLLHRQEHSFCK